MDLEAPMDAWYAYVAVVLVSVAFAAIALTLASLPPPDAPKAATTIERVTSSDYAASARYDHDADVVTIDHETITLENDHGVAHGSFAYGTVVPVNGHDRLENVTRGQAVNDAYRAERDDPQTDATAEFFAEVAAADRNNTGRQIHANGEVIARTVAVEDDSAVGLEVRATQAREFESDLAEEVHDLEEDDVSIPATVYVSTIGDPDGSATVELEGEPVTDEVSVGGSENWLRGAVTGFTCRVGGFWCDDDPTVVTVDHRTETFSELDAERDEQVTLVQGGIADLTDSSEDTVELWTGTYDIRVSVDGPDFEACDGTIDRPGVPTTICAPERTLEDFDDPHWHDQQRGVHYVTLVEV